MLRNLKAEMERYGVSCHDIHKLIGKTERSVRDKINGRVPFTVMEAIKIRDFYFRGFSMEYLFVPFHDQPFIEEETGIISQPKVVVKT